MFSSSEKCYNFLSFSCFFFFAFPCHQFNRIGWRKMFSGEFYSTFPFSQRAVIVSLVTLENALLVSMRNNGWRRIQICHCLLCFSCAAEWGKFIVFVNRQICELWFRKLRRFPRTLRRILKFYILRFKEQLKYWCKFLHKHTQSSENGR